MPNAKESTKGFFSFVRMRVVRVCAHFFLKYFRQCMCFHQSIFCSLLDRSDESFASANPQSAKNTLRCCAFGLRHLFSIGHTLQKYSQQLNFKCDLCVCSSARETYFKSANAFEGCACVCVCVCVCVCSELVSEWGVTLRWYLNAILFYVFSYDSFPRKGRKRILSRLCPSCFVAVVGVAVVALAEY